MEWAMELLDVDMKADVLESVLDKDQSVAPSRQEPPLLSLLVLMIE